MLYKQIKQIRNKNREYQTHLWDFSFSGNTLELSAKPNYAHSSDKYRMGVIAVGQVLRVIEHNAFLHHYQTQIHSFPSLDETQLIATIRLHKQFGDTNNKLISKQESINKTDSITKLIKEIASHYSFIFNLSAVNSEVVKAVRSFTEKESSSNHVYSLYSTMDNPFIWLKVGQWLEGIKILLRANPHLKPPLIKTMLQAGQRTSLASSPTDSSYCQALVVLNNNDKTPQDKKQLSIE